MKRFYIGFIMSFIFIVGGILVSVLYKPTVNMAAKGDYYYSAEKSIGRESTEDGVTKKLIDGDEDTLKIRFTIKDYSGNMNIDHNFYFKDEDLSKEEKEIFKRYKLDEKRTLKAVIVNYKWIDKPKNLAIVKENIFFNKIYVSISKRKLILDNGEIALNYTGSLNRNVKDENDNSYNDSLYIYGENGSGTLDIEYKSIYK